MTNYIILRFKGFAVVTLLFFSATKANFSSIDLKRQYSTQRAMGDAVIKIFSLCVCMSLCAVVETRGVHW